MKRILFALVALLLASVCWGAPLTLTLMNNGIVKFPEGEDQFRGAVGVIEKIAGDYAAKNGIKVEFVYRDVTQGSLTFDTMLAAGKPPDVWIDASGYMPNYMNDNYALQLEKYMDTKPYIKGLLDLYTIGGHVYCAPLVNIATGMAINTTMLEAVGYTMPSVDKWTTDEFLNLAGKLKAAGYPATMIMGKGGFIGWDDVWLYAFGAKMIDNGKVAINSKEARAALAFIKQLIDSGYAYPNALEQNDDAGVELFTTGQVFSCMMQNGHTDYWIPEQVKAGKTKLFGYTFVEFPHAVGMKHAPVSGYQTVAIAHKSKVEATNKLIGGLVAAVTGKEAQWYYCTVTGGFPTISGFTPQIGTAAAPSYKAIREVAATAGVYKEWPDGPKYAEVKRLWATMTEQWLRGKLTTDELLNQFEVEGNKVLK